jgi:hypothetical protein
MKKNKKSELDAALLAVENGASHKGAASGGLNKSIIAREMRKRKNEKGRIAKQKNVDRVYEDALKYYEISIKKNEERMS